jgi:hypothetical protein
MTITAVAGVDVGREFLNVAILPTSRSFRAPNAPAAIGVSPSGCAAPG